MFVNLPDAKQVAVVDRTKQTVTARWPMEKFQANFPMALDEPNHRLFVGCRKPARLVVFDTQTGKPAGDFQISGDTDDLFLDAKRNRVYISCGEGFIDILQFSTGNAAERLPRLQTRPGARTSFFSPDLGAFCLGVPQQGATAAELRIFRVTN